MIVKTTKQFLKEMNEKYKLKGKDQEVAKILFSRYLRMYNTREEAESRTELEIELYLVHRVIRETIRKNDENKN